MATPTRAVGKGMAVGSAGYLAYPHLSYSITPSKLVSAFVTHSHSGLSARYQSRLVPHVIPPPYPTHPECELYLDPAAADPSSRRSQGHSQSNQ